MKVLVTGANGYIGRNVVQLLASIPNIEVIHLILVIQISQNLLILLIWIF